MRTTQRTEQEARGRALYLGFVVAVMAVVALKADFTVESAFAALARGDSDDIMRFLSVRDWMGGQGWFDTMQYRVMAPEGISLHWSRYVDAGIAGLIGAAGLFVPAATAQAFALAAWPVLLHLVLIALTLAAGRRALGRGPAAIAAVSLMLWPILGDYFGPTRIDHHNVQIVLLSLVVFALLPPGRGIGLGAVGGIAAAASLAIGLENLAGLALAGVILCLRVLRDPEAESGRLSAFAGAAAVAAPLFFAGQTPVAEWGVAACDELSPPYLALLALAAGLSLALVAAARRIDAIAGRGAVLAVCGGIAALAAAVLLRPCLGGPYGALPAEVREMMHAQIVEAKPMLGILAEGRTFAIAYAVPLAGALGLALWGWAARRRDGSLTPTEARALPVLFAFAAAGLIGALFQMRLMVFAVPAVPLLTGFGLWRLFRRAHARGGLGPRAALVAGVLATLYFPQALKLGQSVVPAVHAEGNGVVWVKGCRDMANLAALEAFPAGRVLAPDPISVSLLLASRHSVLSAPYHRSEAAMSNVHFPFVADAEGFAQVLDRTRADYVVLCRSETPARGASLAAHLSAGGTAEGLRPLPLPEGSPLVAFEVVRR